MWVACGQWWRAAVNSGALTIYANDRLEIFRIFMKQFSIPCLKGAVSSIFSVTKNSPKTYLIQWNR